MIYFSGETEGIGYEVAMQYTAEYTENVHSYVNNINTIEGGTHVSGFRSALTRTLNNYGKKENMFKDLVPSGDDFREGLTAVISTRVPHPQFEGQTKTKLGNGEVEGIITTAVGDALSKYLEENPKTAKTIVRKGVLAAEAREAARKAKDVLRKRKNVLGGGGLPGKLRDCISKEMERCELYLVEGDSAGGSAEGGRLRDYQAILPLRGKIINAYKSREDKVLANEEVQSMIQAIGIGIGDEQDVAKRRYNKIIIMSVDGDEHVFVRDAAGVRMTTIGQFIDTALEHAGADTGGYARLAERRTRRSAVFWQRRPPGPLPADPRGHPARTGGEAVRGQDGLRPVRPRHGQPQCVRLSRRSDRAPTRR